MTTKYSFSPFQVDTSTGEANADGVKDEYQIEDFDIVAADYMLRVVVSNFRNAWENMDLDTERVDEYGLGARESLAEDVSVVINILGMQPCEVSFYYSRLILLKANISPLWVIRNFLDHQQ
jgi:coatomer subunit gamma